MSSRVCVHCHNKKPINSTNNRLVVESCGHVKCMDCLLREKSGCVACAKLISDNGTINDNNSGKDQEQISCESLLTNISIQSEEHIKNVKPQALDVEKKSKPETSHIRVELDATGSRCYICMVCKKRFHARSQVGYHAYCNGQRKPYQCPECNKSFATHSHFKYHMRVHRNERIYACDVCGDSFFQMSKLQRHKLKHTKEKKYSCNLCSKGFNNLTSLRKHELTHTEVRPYKCSVCSRCFRDQSNYRRHVAKHEVKACSCGGCSTGARCLRGTGPAGGTGARAQLSRRAHQCPRCPQAFHSRKDMRRHYTVHTDKKPFGCKVCNRRFRRKDNLDRHIRNTHPNYVPATAMDCDETALKEISTNGNSHVDHADQNNPGITYESKEKAILEILNPLPPLSQDLMQQHMQLETNQKDILNCESKSVTDKSYIIEANNARESVIFGPVRKYANPKVDKVVQECEYVHKIRRAHCMSQKDSSLPPIDEKRMLEIEEKATRNNWDVGAPPKNVELYKKILYESGHKEGAEDDGRVSTPSDCHEMHWRRKMKLNIN